MREILFRGKTSDGEWVEGFYSAEEYNLNTHSIEYIPRIQLLGKCVSLGVIPETIGQYTGLTDKNGRKIFEGDIVKVTYTSSDGGTRTETTLVNYDEIDCCFYPMRWNESCEWCDYSTEIKEIEVIGNIHDNPELLENSSL